MRVRQTLPAWAGASRPRAILAAIARREWLRRVLALAATGCGRSREPARDPRSTLTVQWAELLEDTPQMFTDSSAQFLMFLPLLTRNARGELGGQLAWRWEHSPDYREWTYHLRPGIRWHDGAPVTADDVKFSLELLAHPDLPFSSLGRAVESITVLDPSTIRIRDRHADRYQFWTIYYPKHLLKDLDPKKFASWDFWRQPVGTGPFRFLRYVPRTMMELEANPASYKGKPRIERIVFKFAGAPGLTDLLSGDVDLIPGPALGISRALRDPRFRTYHYDEGPGSSASPAWAIFWNNQHALFRDASVRRALTLAINRRELLQVLTLPEDLPLIDAPFTFRQRLRGQLPPPLPYDPGQSRALLESAGWHDRNGDGVRERDGRAFRFSALVSGPVWEATALYVQDQLRRVGVDMQIHNMEGGSNVARFKAGQFEARFGNIWLGPTSVEEFFGKASPFGYHNDTVVDLIDRVTATADPDVEDRLYGEFADIIRADAPVTFLFPRLQMSVGNRRLQGLSGSFADPFWYMDELWLEDRPER